MFIPKPSAANGIVAITVEIGVNHRIFFILARDRFAGEPVFFEIPFCVTVSKHSAVQSINGSHPQFIRIPGIVNGEYDVVAYGSRILTVKKMQEAERPAFFYDLVEAVVGPYKNVPVLVCYAKDAIGADGRIVKFTVSKARNFSRLRIEQVKSFVRPDPHFSILVFTTAPHTTITQMIEVVGMRIVTLAPTRARIEAIHAFIVSADPEISFAVFENGGKRVVGQALGVVKIIFVRHKSIAVITMQAINGGDP